MLCAGVECNDRRFTFVPLNLMPIYFRPGRSAIPGSQTASFLGRFVPHGSGVPTKKFLGDFAIAPRRPRCCARPRTAILLQPVSFVMPALPGSNRIDSRRPRRDGLTADIGF